MLGAVDKRVLAGQNWLSNSDFSLNMSSEMLEKCSHRCNISSQGSPENLLSLKAQQTSVIGELAYKIELMQ